MEFNKTELKVLKSLNTPQKIQSFLNNLRFRFEKKDTYNSPRKILKDKKAHCFDGALLAAAVLWINGEKPLLLDLKVEEGKGDVDHVVVLFKRFDKWGAISKTNHAVLRYREPVYKSVRELAMSYFHEYFINNGEKTLRSFSRPFDLSKFGTEWLTSEKDLYYIVEALDNSPHTQILSNKQIKNLRKADKIEIKAGEIVEYKP
ncbi:MAG: transglutaminase-like domain-containing protein [Minisyncoccota bacterium]